MEGCELVRWKYTPKHHYLFGTVPRICVGSLGLEEGEEAHSLHQEVRLSFSDQELGHFGGVTAWARPLRFIVAFGGYKSMSEEKRIPYQVI